MIRVVIAMKDPLLMLGAASAVEASCDCTVAGRATTVAELDGALQATPDVLVFDKALEHDAPGTMSRLQSERPALRLLVYVPHTAEECVLRTAAECSLYHVTHEELDRMDCCLVSLRHGARGCIPRGVRPAELIGAIRAIVAGEIAAAPWLSAHLTRPVAGAAPRPQLSARQMQIVRLVARGMSNKSIARELGLREQTVKNHLARAGRTLGRTNRLDLALFALQQQMLWDARTRTGPAA